MSKDNVIARINLGKLSNHAFELVETPKGLLEARIDGDPISTVQLKELNQWLKMMRGKPPEE